MDATSKIVSVAVETVSEPELCRVLVDAHCPNIPEAVRRARVDGARIWVRGRELRLDLNQAKAG